MSLVALLGGNKAVDTELNALFTAKPVVSQTAKKTPAVTIPIPGSSKESSKKRKSGPNDTAAVPEVKKRAKKESSTINDTPKASDEKKSAKKGSNAAKGDKGKTKAKEVEPDSDDSESDDKLENAYLIQHKSSHVADEGLDSEGVVHSDDNEDEDEDDDDDEKPIEHETVAKAKKVKRSGQKIKYVPEDETPELRERRTIFVGNLPVDVAQKKPLLKQLHRHILSSIPTAKIESTRFRSVAFQTPTSKLPTDQDDESATQGKPNPKTTSAAPNKEKSIGGGRQHDIDRASTWRQSQSQNQNQNDKDETALSKDEKRYLSTNQKKKIAFINQDFHSSSNSINAYIVFAHPLPPSLIETRPKNLPPLPQTLNPYEAAVKAVKACDGTLLLERVIRVDLVGKKKGIVGLKEGGEGDPQLVLIEGTDPKSSVFVGNLDFASKEEDLRAFFEGVVSAERGPAPMLEDNGDGEADEEEEEEEEAGANRIRKTLGWVTRVRIVRDKDTQLGKGFGYVQFRDHESVDEVLAMEPTKLKFAKRKLRVQRCRTIPGSSTSTRQATASATNKKDLSSSTTASTSSNKRPSSSIPIVVPKGDPSLGDKIKDLSKEARKQVKSSDADRVARRLAKKKARMGMRDGDGKPIGIGGGHGGKDRVRERKTTGGGHGGNGKKNLGTKVKKGGRVRSEKSALKRNGKKAAAATS